MSIAMIKEAIRIKEALIETVGGRTGREMKRLGELFHELAELRRELAAAEKAKPARKPRKKTTGGQTS